MPDPKNPIEPLVYPKLKILDITGFLDNKQKEQWKEEVRAMDSAFSEVLHSNDNTRKEKQDAFYKMQLDFGEKWQKIAVDQGVEGKAKDILEGYTDVAKFALKAHNAHNDNPKDRALISESENKLVERCSNLHAINSSISAEELTNLTKIRNANKAEQPTEEMMKEARAANAELEKMYKQRYPNPNPPIPSHDVPINPHGGHAPGPIMPGPTSAGQYRAAERKQPPVKETGTLSEQLGKAASNWAKATNPEDKKAARLALDEAQVRFGAEGFSKANKDYQALYAKRASSAGRRDPALEEAFKKAGERKNLWEQYHQVALLQQKVNSGQEPKGKTELAKKGLKFAKERQLYSRKQKHPKHYGGIIDNSAQAWTAYGRAVELEQEIEREKQRGINTQEKEDRLAGINSNIEGLNQARAGSLANSLLKTPSPGNPARSQPHAPSHQQPPAHGRHDAPASPTDQGYYTPPNPAHQQHPARGGAPASHGFQQAPAPAAHPHHSGPGAPAYQHRPAGGGAYGNPNPSGHQPHYYVPPSQPEAPASPAFPQPLARGRHHAPASPTDQGYYAPPNPAHQQHPARGGAPAYPQPPARGGAHGNPNPSGHQPHYYVPPSQPEAHARPSFPQPPVPNRHQAYANPAPSPRRVGHNPRAMRDAFSAQRPPQFPQRNQGFGSPPPTPVNQQNAGKRKDHNKGGRGG